MFRVKLKVIEKNKVSKGAQSLRVLFSSSASFDFDLSRLTETDTSTAASVSEAVSGILSRIKLEGDSALLDITNSLEDNSFSEIDDLQVCNRDMEQAWERLGDNDRKALQVAANRITDFHQKQCQSSWSFRDDSGNVLGQRISPIDRVGVYVPGGKASYPSSVLMSIIPARVAGVSEVIAFTPSTSGAINDYVLAAFSLAGVDRVFMAGGAQAIGAMAFGTALVPKVDKIVGPGGAFVAEAKRQVFGSVGIDMIAGPSEVLVIADDQAPVEWVALDMFAQAEHDPAAQSIAIVFSENYAKDLEVTIKRLIEEMPRKKIIKESLSNRGAIICCANRREAAEIANRIAPEHLGLMIDNPYELLDEIKNFGAVFVGNYSSEAMGDYVAGPSHVLPTSGSAKYSSPLGVYDFVKRSSVVELSEQGSKELGVVAATLAESEGLYAHAKTALARNPGSNE